MQPSVFRDLRHRALVVFRYKMKSHFEIPKVAAWETIKKIIVFGTRQKATACNCGIVLETRWGNRCEITPNKAFRHVETLFVQGRILVQNKEICE